MREWMNQIRSFFQTLSNNQLKKIIVTVSISAIGASIAANYYFHILSSKNKKRILTTSRHIMQTVKVLKICFIINSFVKKIFLLSRFPS